MLTGTGGSSCRDGGAAEGPAVQPTPHRPHAPLPPRLTMPCGWGSQSGGFITAKTWVPNAESAAGPSSRTWEAGREGWPPSGRALAGPGAAHPGPTEGRGGRVNLHSWKTSFVGDRMGVKNTGFGVGQTPVQTLALPLTSCRVTLDKLFPVSLGLSLLSGRQLWKLPSWATGRARATACATEGWHKVGAHTWPWPLLLMMVAQQVPPEVLE